MTSDRPFRRTRRTAWGATFCLAAAASAVASCRGETTPARVDSAAARNAATMATGAIGGYAETAIANPGRVHGSVRLVGDVPRDTTVRPTSDMSACGAELVDVTIERSGDRLAGVIVWLEGVHAGKPLPLVRRHDIVNEGCQLTPRVQAVAAGGTLNLRSLDRATHRNRFVRDGSAAPLALVTETEDGQVVPIENILDRPGRVEIRCDNHPWTRAWIAVFDHPYFTVTTADGAFAIDSVPPGRYRIHAWHERTGDVTRDVAVEGDVAADIEVRIASGSR